MKTLNVLYHMARADLLERTRRYSFLVVLGMVIWLGYATATGFITVRLGGHCTGEVNSAWIGALMTMTGSAFLVLFGFYLVKGSVARDYDTGVGQIIATTPLTGVQYAVGKWLSNWAVLVLMVLTLMGSGALMILVAGKPLDLWDLGSPLLFISLPCMALVAALAVLFDTISWLRGGIGNVVYFFLFAFYMSGATQNILPDFTGFVFVSDQILHAAQVVYPEIRAGNGLWINPKGVVDCFFAFDGIPWTADIVGVRLALGGMALAIVLVAARFFDRFNPSLLSIGRRPTAATSSSSDVAVAPVPSLPVHLAPLAHRPRSFRFGALYLAELNLLLKGQRWWWYAITGGLLVAQLVTQPEISRRVLAVAWVWPLLVLSSLGTREIRHNTGQIVFAAPRPILNQLPAAWLAAVSVMVLTGAGALVKSLLSADIAGLLTWLAGVVFVPSLALALGVATSSRKVFEVVYVPWMYMILNGFAPLDFVGMGPGSPWPVYLLLAAGLLLVALGARYGQLKTR